MVFAGTPPKIRISQNPCLPIILPQISQLVVAPEHKNSLINSAFATELGGYIADSRIDAWIFGHSHTNIGTIIGNTRIVCNQMGYVFTGEHLKDFKGDKFIEV